MRRSLTAFLSAALSAALLIGPVAAPAPALAAVTDQAVREFAITGTGWGHGIGMSQYGAQGYALKGYDYSYILRHYYKGTVLKTLNELFGSQDANPWVNVNLDKSKATRSSWTVKGYKSVMLVSGGSKAVTVNNAYRTLRASGGKVVMDGVAGDFGPSVSISADEGKGTVVVSSASGPFDYTYVRYRDYVKLYASGDKLKAVNTVRMEKYLYGVVPRESPSSWKAEALKAQAVAARSYAWGTNPDKDRDGDLDGELYCTTSSQVYGGHSRLKGGDDANVYMHEAPSTNAAVDGTAGKVVYYSSSSLKTVVTAYFFSQSGGRTANIEDVWGSTPQPFFKSVDDPYESLAGANKCPWPSVNEKHLDGIELAAGLRAELSGVPVAPAYVTGVSIERAASGYPRYVTFTFNNGGSFKTSGWSVRNAFGLLSPMFYFSGFPMSRIYGANRFATAAAVSASSFTTAPVVVLASGEDFADALTGSGLAGAAQGSLLLSYRSVLPGETSRELKRLAPSTVYMMGGTSALSGAVENAVRAALPSAKIERIAGTDRYATAAKAAGVIAGIATPSKVLLVSGTSWPDAAAASALAYGNKYPILLTRQASLDPVAAGSLRALKPAVTLIAGGTAVVSSAAQNAAATATGGTTTRLAGADRYSTSAAIARYLNSAGSPEGVWNRDHIYFATGGAFPDALTGGVLAGKTRHPMLLTMPTGVANATKFYLRDNRSYITKLWIFGGSAAVSNTGFAALDAAMMN